MVKHLENNRQAERSHRAGVLRRGLAVAVLAGLGLSGCSSSGPSGSAPAATPDNPSAAATSTPEPSGQSSPDGSPGVSPSSDSPGASPSSDSPGASPDADNARPSGTPEPPLPNPVTTPVAKAERGGQSRQPSIKAAADGSGFSDTVSYGDGVTLKVTKARRAVEDGHGPGVFPGREYVALDLEITNAASTPLDLSQVVVTAYHGDTKQLAPAVYTPSGETTDFGGAIQPGGKATATYAFAVPTSELGNVTMVVDFDGAHASAVYSGKVGLS